MFPHKMPSIFTKAKFHLSLQLCLNETHKRKARVSIDEIVGTPPFFTRKAETIVCSMPNLYGGGHLHGSDSS